MPTQELSTVSYLADISKVRFDLGWQKASSIAKGWDNSVPNKLSNEDPLAKIMLKSKKDMAFIAELSSDFKKVTLYAKTGGEKSDVLSTWYLSAGNNKLWVADMTKLKEKSKLVSDGDLKTFTKNHPDTELITKLKAELATLEEAVKKGQKAVEDKKKAITDAGGKL